MTSILERHKIDHIKLGLHNWIYGAGSAPLRVSSNQLYLDYDETDFYLVADALTIKDSGIDHTAISNIGSNSHSVIDTHLGDATIHFTEASIDHGSISGLLDDDHTQYTLRSDWAENGFADRTVSTLTWTDSDPDYTLSVQPTGASFDYYVAGVKYTSTGDTVQIDNTEEGIHYIYYDGDTLTSVANPSSAVQISLILNYCLVSILYWDVSAAEAIYVGEERHGKIMAPATHVYLHFLEGLRYADGLALDSISADGTGATADAQFGVEAGSISDEDLFLPVSAIASTTGLPIYYLTGAGADLNKSVEAGFSARTFDGTTGTRLAWNEYTGGAWQLSQVTNNQFVLYHIFATTDKDYPMISVMGQNDYNTKSAARAGALVEIKTLVLSALPLPEIRPIATVIFQTNTSYASAINARIVTTDDGGDYIDWRSETIDRVSLSTSDHGLLLGLGDDDHTIYPLLLGRSGGQTLIGGTDSGDDLTFQSTSDGTKGNIVLGTSEQILINTTVTSSYGQLVIENSGLPAILLRNTDASYTDDDVGLASYQDQFIIQNRDADGGFSATPFKLNINAPTDSFTVDSAGNVGIGTASPNANALLDVSSTTKAFMPPRMTTTQRDNISSPTEGMLIYNLTTHQLEDYNGSAWGAV